MLSTRSQALRLSNRAQNRGGARFCMPTKRAQSSKTPGSGIKAPPSEESADPHAMASELINKNYANRTSGTEAIQSYLTPEMRMKNFGMATALFGFVGWVWWYSMNAVGQSKEDSLESLASEARVAKSASSISQQEAEELANLDMGVEQDDLDETVTLAVAAPDDIAKHEEEQNKAALAAKSGGGDSKRPLWKRIVLFWKA